MDQGVAMNDEHDQTARYVVEAIARHWATHAPHPPWAGNRCDELEVGHCEQSARPSAACCAAHVSSYFMESEHD